MESIKADAGRMDRIHLPFLVPALLFGVLGGFTLAVTLPALAAAGRIDLSWLSHAQVHGHLQVVGFAMLFVIGVALRIAPRFGRGSLALEGLITPAGALLVAGILLRTVGQPMADRAPFALLMVGGAAAEWLGALAFLIVFTATLAPAIRTFQPHATLLAMSFTWFAVQATVGLWWLLALAIEGNTVLEYSRNSALLTMQVYGALLCAVLGVGTRTFPALFGMPAPRPATIHAAAVTLNVGVAVWAIALTLRATRGIDASAYVALSTLMVGAAITATVLILSAGRLRHRFAPASAGFAWAMQPALLWLLLTGLVLIWLGVTSAASGTAIPADQIDAARHIFLIGVVTLGIVAMGQLMLPEFASERLTHPAWRGRGPAFGAAISLAVVLRGVAPLTGIDGEIRWWLMAAGGSLMLLTTGVFALLFWRARRRHRRYVARLAAMRAGGPAIPVVER